MKKIRDTKGTFHAKMGTIKDRNGMDLTKAEDIKKRWQEYTEDYTFDCINHNKLWKILKEMGIPDHLTCLLRNHSKGDQSWVFFGRNDAKAETPVL